MEIGVHEGWGGRTGRETHIYKELYISSILVHMDVFIHVVDSLNTEYIYYIEYPVKN